MGHVASLCVALSCQPRASHLRSPSRSVVSGKMVPMGPRCQAQPNLDTEDIPEGDLGTTLHCPGEHEALGSVPECLGRVSHLLLQRTPAD